MSLVKTHELNLNFRVVLLIKTCKLKLALNENICLFLVLIIFNETKILNIFTSFFNEKLASNLRVMSLPKQVNETQPELFVCLCLFPAGNQPHICYDLDSNIYLYLSSNLLTFQKKKQVRVG